jgi:hypothetical protein
VGVQELAAVVTTNRVRWRPLSSKERLQPPPLPPPPPQQPQQQKQAEVVAML